MKKNKKIVILFLVAFICIMTVIISDRLNMKENIYVVSKEETNSKDSILLQDENKGNNFEEVDISNTQKISEDINTNTNTEMITIYISGQVNNPGVVTLESDKRLADAIELLGGVTLDADLNRINMALKIKDEQHYIIPKIGEEVLIEDLTINNIQTNDETTEGKGTKININIATIKELEDLPGVGEATANKIVKHREDNGNFKSIEEIKNVNGIGDKKYADLKDLISVNWYNNI